MARVAKSVTVSCDPKRIIEYIAEVRNHPAFLGPLKSVNNMSGDPHQVGSSWDWTFIMAGVEFTGRAETVAYEAGRKYSFRTTSGIKSTFVYSCEPAGGQTKLTIDVTYEVPTTMMQKMQAPMIEKWNEAEGARAVENIKAILDS